MFRESWRSGRYWLWLWRDRVPAEVRVGALIVVSAITLWGGWLAADGLSSANAEPSSTSASGAQALIDARSLRVTVRKARVYTVTRTVHDRRVVTTPGRVRTVTVPVTTNVSVIRNRTVPVVSTRVVTVTAPGRTSTDVLTRTRTVTETVTTPPLTVTETVVPAPITTVVTVTVHKK